MRHITLHGTALHQITDATEFQSHVRFLQFESFIKSGSKKTGWCGSINDWSWLICHDWSVVFHMDQHNRSFGFFWPRDKWKEAKTATVPHLSFFEKKKNLVQMRSWNIQRHLNMVDVHPADSYPWMCQIVCRVESGNYRWHITTGFPLAEIWSFLILCLFGPRGIQLVREEPVQEHLLPKLLLMEKTHEQKRPNMTKHIQDCLLRVP